MLDGEVPERVEVVWGIPVPIASDGRRRWPEAIRTMAAQRVAAGATIRDVVAETGAHKSLVAKWVREGRKIGPEDTSAFVEVLAPARDKATTRNAGKRAVAAAPADPALVLECRIRIADAELTIPAGYPAHHLAAVLRAARSAQ